MFTSSIEAQRIDYPDNPNVIQKSLGMEVQAFTEPGEGITDYNYDFRYGWQYANTQRLSVSASFQNIYLFDGFDPTRTDATPLPGNQDYSYWQGGVRYSTDQRKKFSSRFEVEAGEFFNGYSYGISGGLVYRYQPFGSINLRFNYRYIDLPEPYAQYGPFSNWSAY